MLRVAVKDPDEAAEILKAWQYANGNKPDKGHGV